MAVPAFSCAAMRTTSEKWGLLPVWSPCACVLMMVVIGSSVTARTASRMAGPQPGFFVSTSTTPWSSVTSIAV